MDESKEKENSLFQETVPIETDDGKHLVCDACGQEVYEDETHCTNCGRKINWDKQSRNIFLVGVLWTLRKGEIRHGQDYQIL